MVMTRLVSNAKAKIQRREVHGRQYLVAPITILAPGVLNGSKGALYYPPDEIARDHEAWNGIPILINHSTRNGAAVSARCPDVLASQEVGRVFNSRITKQGRQVVDGWFDAEALKRVSAGVYDKLMHGTPVSVSTGLFTENEVKEGRDHKGRSYSHVARAYRPDHLAVLTDQPGACSIEDGCGVLLNQRADNAFCPTGEGGGVDPSCGKGEAGIQEPERIAAKIASRIAEDYARNGFTTEHQDFRSKYADLDDSAKLAVVRELAKRGAVEKHISRKRNAPTGSEIVDSISRTIAKLKEEHERVPTNRHDKWNESEGYKKLANNSYTKEAGMAKIPQEKREEIVDGLISNCDCGWSEEDRETLNGFADERLLKMDEYRRSAVRNAELVANAEKALAEGEVCNEDDQECLDEQKKKKDMMMPAMNAEKWLSTAPPEIRSAVENAMAIEAREKQELVDALTAGVADKDPVANVLKTKTLDELRTLQALAPKRPAAANWSGNAGSRSVHNAPAKVEPLRSPDSYAEVN